MPLRWPFHPSNDARCEVKSITSADQLQIQGTIHFDLIEETGGVLQRTVARLNKFATGLSCGVGYGKNDRDSDGEQMILNDDQGI